MIKLLHTITKVGMVCWTLITGGGLLLTVISALGATTKSADPNASGYAGVAIIGGLMLWGALWFFPMIGMAVMAYFTRPQAWAEKNPPAAAPPVVPHAEPLPPASNQD